MTLNVGDTAPAFSLPSTAGELSLAALLKSSEKGVIVYFYPAAMTPGCTTQACDFRDSIGSLVGAGYTVVGVSPDPLEKLEEFAERDQLSFPLAADEDHAVAEAYGAWGEKKNYGKTYEGLIRSTFVVSPDGTLALTLRNVKATGHVGRLRKILGFD